MGLLSKLFAPKAEPERPLPSEQYEQIARRRVGVMLLRGTYDAAQTIDDNAYHWKGTDALSADRANSFSVRKTLRERSRYELSNNCFARGIVDTHANYVVGTGPRLQMLSADKTRNTEIEQRWHIWAATIDLASKLRTLQVARDGDGEGFGQIITNPGLPLEEQLDVQLVECDRVSSPSLDLDPNNVDGVLLDEHGNPVSYTVAKSHPGGPAATIGEYETVRADWMVHWFRRARPEQHRGIPTTTPALPLFAVLRRFVLATLGAAEGAANIGGVLYTDAPPGGEAEEGQAFDLIPTSRNMLMSLPYGWKLTQLAAQHPNTQFREFIRCILNECGRPFHMPINVVLGDSSQHNFASGRLDQRTYFTHVAIEQHEMGLRAVDKIFSAWLRLARRYYVWPELKTLPLHRWLWDKPEPVDEVKAAKGQRERLRIGTSTIPDEWAAKGLDHEPAHERGAEALGVSLEEYRALLRRGIFGNEKENAAEAAAEAAEEAIQEAVNHALP